MSVGLYLQQLWVKRGVAKKTCNPLLSPPLRSLDYKSYDGSGREWGSQACFDVRAWSAAMFYLRPGLVVNTGFQKVLQGNMGLF